MKEFSGLMLASVWCYNQRILSVKGMVSCEFFYLILVLK